jgi:hypothetical protein
VVQKRARCSSHRLPDPIRPSFLVPFSSAHLVAKHSVCVEF